MNIVNITTRLLESSMSYLKNRKIVPEILAVDQWSPRKHYCRWTDATASTRDPSSYRQKSPNSSPSSFLPENGPSVSNSCFLTRESTDVTISRSKNFEII